MKDKDVEPGIRRLFPWALFLVLAALLVLGSLAYGDEDEYACFGAGRYEAMSKGWGKENCPKPPPAASWSDWTCEKLRQYLSNHTEAEARATAAEMHLPKWLIRKAEKCAS